MRLTLLLLGLMLAPSIAAQTPSNERRTFYGHFFAVSHGVDRRVSILCVAGDSCRIELRSMYVRSATRQCVLTTKTWDGVSATERRRQFHTPPQRHGTHATSTFSFAIRGREVAGLREVYETAEFRDHDASSETFTYRPTSEREEGSGFDVSGCDELSLH